MDLSVRNGQQHNAATATPTSNTSIDASPRGKSGRNGRLFESNKLIRVLYVVLLAGIAVLLIAISFSFVFGTTQSQNISTLRISKLSTLASVDQLPVTKFTLVTSSL